MPRNLSGVYTLPAGNPVVPGTTIDANWANSTLSDMANEITNSLSRTGAGGMLAPFRIDDGNVTGPGLAFLNETNTGYFRSGAGATAFSVLGVSTLQLNTTAVTVPSTRTLNAQGNALVGGTFGVTGVAAFGSTIAVTGAITALGGVLGNITAASGTSTFADVVITGSLDMTVGSSATITGLSTPVNASDAANKSYVDTQVATRLALTGGTMTGAIAMSTNKITGLGTPTADTDAATKAYVDSVAQGLDVKGSVRAATTGNITLSGAQTIDGVAVIAGDRVLVKDQSTAANNGIYVAAAGAWSRAADADTWNELVGAFVFVEDGTTNDNSGWVCTSPPGGTLGVTAVTFEQFSGAGQINAGTGMTKNGNTLNVNTASASRIVVGADEIDLAQTGVTAGTYKSVTVDLYGRVTAGTNPTTLAGYGISDAYTTAQTDSLLAQRLALTGGTMSGALAMGTNRITGVGDPVNAQDAATKNYIDTIFGSTTSAAASAAAAASSASAASTSASNAASSASSASTSASNALSYLNTFRGQYIGASATDPTVDGNGNALTAGDLYFNTAANEMRVYSGSSWLTSYVPAAAYVLKSGDTMTGALTVNVDSFFNGVRVGRGAGAVSTNTAVGASALAANTSGTNNAAFGTSALAANTSALYGTAIGAYALASNTTGNSNTGVGYGSLNVNTTGASNTALGFGSLQANTTASFNTAVGYQSMYSTQTGGTHAALGFQSLYSITQNVSGSVGFGYQAGYSTSTGSVTALGTQSLYANTTGANNVAAGNSTLYANTTGSQNTAVGDQALRFNTTASNNTAVGYQAGYSNVTGAGSVFLGTQAGYAATASQGVHIGYSAGYRSSGNQVIYIGYTAGPNTATLGTESNNVGIGWAALTSTTSGSNNIAIGTQALQANTTASNNTAVGYQAGYSNTTGDQNTAVGYAAMYANTTGQYNTALGRTSLYANTTGGANTATGYGALAENTTGSNNTASGLNALTTNTTGAYNSAIGRDALYSNTTASANTAVGYQASYANTTGADNTAVGFQALQNNTTGSSLVGVGEYALVNNTTGNYSVAVGKGALQFNTTASNNTAVGYQAGYSGTTAADSTYLGFSAGYSVTTGTRNTLVGFYAGSGITTGTFNSFLGTQAGQGVTSGSKNTIVGCYSGNQGGLDIRTASNYIVLSDGDGNAQFVHRKDFGVAITDRPQISSSYVNTQNKSVINLYEGTNGNTEIVSGYATADFVVGTGGTSGNVAYGANGGSYLSVASGIMAIVGTTFTIGSNTYTVTSESSEGYVYCTPDASGEAATGTLVGLRYATEGFRVYDNRTAQFKSTVGVGGTAGSTSGAGITFPATQNASSDANTLDDYEEGTWNPTWVGDVSNPTVTYSEQLGHYTKIGRLVTYTLRLVITGRTGGSGNLNITGLPFSSAAAGVAGTVTFSYGYASPILQQQMSGAEIITYTEYAGVSNTRAQVSALPTSGSFYFVAAGYFYTS